MSTLLARADAAEFPTYLLPQPQAPVKINSCWAWTSDDGRLTDYYTDEAVSFTNVSDETITAIEFRFDFFDSFKAHITWVTAERDGKFSPHVLIDAQRDLTHKVVYPQFSQINIWPGLRNVSCTVSRVLFADGSTWSQKFAP